MPQITPQKISKTFPEYSVTRCKSGWLVKSSCGEVIKHAKTLSAAWQWIGCREIEKSASPSPGIVNDPSEYEPEVFGAENYCPVCGGVPTWVEQPSYELKDSKLASEFQYLCPDCGLAAPYGANKLEASNWWLHLCDSFRAIE